MRRTVVLWLLLCAWLPVAAQQVQAATQQVRVSVRDSTVIKQLFFNGLRDKLNEDYSRGLLSFGKIVAIDPVNAAAYYEIALLNYRMDNLGEAEIAIRKAVAIDKGNMWYWKLLAEFDKRKGNMTDLVRVFDQLIALVPDEDTYYFDRSNALLLQGKRQEALAGYDLIEEKFGASPALAEARERATGERPSQPGQEDLLTGDPVARAKGFLAKNDFKSAAAVLESVAVNYQDDPLFLALYGDVLFENGELPAALIYYQKALKLTDQLYGVWEKVINIHILLGEYKQMIAIGDAALAVYPNQAILYYYMAFALHRELQNEKALTYIKTALQLDGDNNSLQALIVALQAEIFIDENKLADADAAFKKAVDLDPENYLIVNNYAYYLALTGKQLAKAESLIGLAATILPADASVADTYAFVLFKRAKYALARTWAEKALQNNEAENSVYLEHYGDILFFLGETENAVIQWQKSKDAGNDAALLNRKINEKKYFK